MGSKYPARKVESARRRQIHRRSMGKGSIRSRRPSQSVRVYNRRLHPSRIGALFILVPSFHLAGEPTHPGVVSQTDADLAGRDAGRTWGFGANSVRE